MALNEFQAKLREAFACMKKTAQPVKEQEVTTNPGETKFQYTSPDGKVYDVTTGQLNGEEVFNVTLQNGDQKETFTVSTLEQVVPNGVPVEVKKNILNQSKQSTEQSQETVVEDAKIKQKFIDQYGKEKGEQIYYATANKQKRNPETFKKIDELKTTNIITPTGIDTRKVIEPEKDMVKEPPTIPQDVKIVKEDDVRVKQGPDGKPVIGSDGQPVMEPVSSKNIRVKQGPDGKPVIGSNGQPEMEKFEEKKNDEDHEEKETKEDEKEENGRPNPIEGGVGDSLCPENVDEAELALGIEVEMEHIKNNKHISEEAKEEVAQDIALDHLQEIPDYYTRLAAMEAQAREELGLDVPEESDEIENIDTEESEEENSEDEDAIQFVAEKIIKESIDVQGKDIREFAQEILKTWSEQDWETFKQKKG